MQLTFVQIYEFGMSMVTALLGMAYPLFIDKINSIARTYKSRRLSDRFRGEFAYNVFNILLIVCITEMFVIPFVVTATQNSVWEIVLLIIQGVSVFILSMSMIALYDILLTYNNPIRLFQRMRTTADNERRFLDIRELMLYAATDEEQTQLFESCMDELNRQLYDLQQSGLNNNATGQN